MNQKEELEMDVEESTMVAKAKEQTQTEQVNAKKIQRLEEMFAIMLEDIIELKVSFRKLRESVDSLGGTLDHRRSSVQLMKQMSPRRKRSQQSIRIQTMDDCSRGSTAQTTKELSPCHAERGQQGKNFVSENMNYLNVFAKKALEREDKRKKQIEAFKRRVKKLTVSGTVSSCVWFLCGMIVIYQGIKCVKKYNDSPKAAEIEVVDGVNELFPEFTICGAGTRYKGTTPDCGSFCMSGHGDFWYRNGTFQSLDNFVLNLDFWVKTLSLTYQNENETSAKTHLHYNEEDKHPMDSEFATWHPYFHSLYFGQCYTLKLNQTKRFTAVEMDIGGNFKIYPHSPGRIRTIPNPSWYLLDSGFYSFSVYYQLYKMLDNHGEPCNASEHYSPDDCADEAKFKESLQEIGCTVPFFKNKDHICNDTEKAEKALEFYKKMMHKHEFKECLKPCHYLKAYLILSQYVENQQFRHVMLKFGDDGIQVTSAFEAYGELSLFADIGGYVGMFLGLSFSQLSDLSNYVLSKLF